MQCPIIRRTIPDINIRTSIGLSQDPLSERRIRVLTEAGLDESTVNNTNFTGIFIQTRPQSRVEPLMQFTGGPVNFVNFFYLKSFQSGVPVSGEYINYRHTGDQRGTELFNYSEAETFRLTIDVAGQTRIAEIVCPRTILRASEIKDADIVEGDVIGVRSGVKHLLYRNGAVSFVFGFSNNGTVERVLSEHLNRIRLSGAINASNNNYVNAEIERTRTRLQANAEEYHRLLREMSAIGDANPGLPNLEKSVEELSMDKSVAAVIINTAAQTFVLTEELVSSSGTNIGRYLFCTDNRTAMNVVTRNIVQHPNIASSSPGSLSNFCMGADGDREYYNILNRSGIKMAAAFFIYRLCNPGGHPYRHDVDFDLIHAAQKTDAQVVDYIHMLPREAILVKVNPKYNL